MKLNVHLVIIIVAVVLGLLLLRMGRDSAGMNLEQRAAAERYRMYSYLLFAVAAGIAVYHYMLEGKKAHRKGKMSHGKKAYMCGRYR